MSTWSASARARARCSSKCACVHARAHTYQFAYVRNAHVVSAAQLRGLHEQLDAHRAAELLRQCVGDRFWAVLRRQHERRHVPGGQLHVGQCTHGRLHGELRAPLALLERLHGGREASVLADERVDVPALRVDGCLMKFPDARDGVRDRRCDVPEPVDDAVCRRRVHLRRQSVPRGLPPDRVHNTRCDRLLVGYWRQ